MGKVPAILGKAEQLPLLELRPSSPHQSKLDKGERTCVVGHQLFLCPVDQRLAEYLLSPPVAPQVGWSVRCLLDP